MSGVSFILPCLNEERNLLQVLERIDKVRQTELNTRETEIIVSDNGSIDGSVAIATRFGAKVVHCAEKGYGANLKNGIRHAAHPVIVFADADNTYDFTESVRLIARLEDHPADLVVGSRFKGNISRGAMPILHRRLGTPVLNLLINTFHNRSRQSRITDCNSGFRCFYKNQYNSWNVASDGMDFASEMLLKALKNNAVLDEVPITLTRNDKDRVPHLKTWQDGMKHLLRFFVETPNFFYLAGITLFILGLAILAPSYTIGITQLGRLHIFGPHTIMIANIIAGTGIQVWCFGAFIALKDYKAGIQIKYFYQWMIEIREDRLFWFIVFYTLLVGAIFTYILGVWQSHQFKNLHMEDNLLIVAFSVTGLSTLVVNILAIHILKRI